MRKYLRLARTRVSAFAAFAAFTGHVTGHGELTSGALTAGIGVALLASGASGLNQAAERDIDLLMRRTMLRPLPSGELSTRSAVLLSMTFIASGFMVLAIGGSGPLAPLLALCALFIYNGLYTPLKRVTGLAILVGAIAGAMPPAIGWAHSGSPMSAPLLPALCLFFYLWQMPHFWMLLTRHREDYKRAGLPTLWSRLSEPQVKRISLTWITATSASGLMLPLFGPSGMGNVALALILTATTVFVVSGILETVSGERRSYFLSSNIYMLFIMISLLADSVRL